MDFGRSNQRESEEDRLALGINDFTANLHKIIAATEQRNFVLSAFSAHLALSMTQYGARGATSQLMRRILRLSDDNAQSLQKFQAFIDEIENIQHVILKVATKMFVEEKVGVNDEFKEITSTYFRSQCQTVDFSNEEETVAIINGWCTLQTNGKIQEIISGGNISPLSAIILLNAVYFKGIWEEPFKKNNTTMKPFYLNKDNVIDVPTMHVLNYIPYLEFPELDAQCVVLPYVNRYFYMVIIVPNKVDGLDKIEKENEKAICNYEYFERHKEKVLLWLPKFKIESLFKLKQPLTEMGLSDIFDNNGDLSGIVNPSTVPCVIEQLLQKAFIEVNEEGTEAAAVTATICYFGCAAPVYTPRKVFVDKPFMYKLMYKNYTLFSGRVMNPLN